MAWLVHISKQVSIYGHSLGSVLSYDILCHQDTLSSPSPMDLVYQQPKHHVDSAENNENASSCTSPTNSRSRNAHEMVPPHGSEENTPLAPSFPKEEKEPAEHSSSDDHPLSSPDDTTVIFDPDQPCTQENGCCYDPADMLPQERNVFCEATGMNCTVLDGNSENVGTRESESEKPSDHENEINTLRKEVNSLTISSICSNIHSQNSLCHFNYASSILMIFFSD